MRRRRRKRRRIKLGRSRRPSYKRNYRLHEHEHRVILTDMLAFLDETPGDEVVMGVRDFMRFRPDRYDPDYLGRALHRMSKLGMLRKNGHVSSWFGGRFRQTYRLPRSHEQRRAA